MKAYILGDFQAHAWGEAVTSSGINARLMDLIKELRRIRKLAVEDKVGYLFILGDFYQERGRIDVVVQNMLHRECWKFRKAGIKVVIIIGNHDRIPVGDFHALEVFQDLVTVVDKPARFDFSGTRVLAIPFMPEPRKVVEQLMKYGKQADMILMHTSVLNVKLDHGKWTEGIPLKAIPKKPWTFIGHDHTHKKIRKHVYHVGSLLHVDKGDTGKQKVFALYYRESKTSVVEWIPTHGPEFKEITVSDNNIKNTFKKKARKQKLQSIVNGHFITVHYTGKIEYIGELKRKLYKLGARDVDVEPEIKAINEPSIKHKALGRLDHLLVKHVQQLPVAEREDTLILGREILAEALHK